MSSSCFFLDLQAGWTLALTAYHELRSMEVVYFRRFDGLPQSRQTRSGQILLDSTSGGPIGFYSYLDLYPQNAGSPRCCRFWLTV